MLYNNFNKFILQGRFFPSFQFLYIQRNPSSLISKQLGRKIAYKSNIADLNCLLKMCSIDNLFDTNIRKFGAKKDNFLP